MQKSKEASSLYAKKLESPTSLTEFAPLNSEIKPQGSQFSLSNLFRRSKVTKDNKDQEPNLNLPKESYQENILVPGIIPDIIINSNEELSSEHSEINSVQLDNKHDVLSSINNQENQGRDREFVYHRSMTNVLKRISNILDRKNTTLQDYKDSDFKQYWMPDSNCKECYECGDKFTTFRRRHHCRICGQIFCRTCCNQGIPGRILGYTGDLRVCTYCCKVVLSYIKSLDAGSDIANDVKALKDDLQQKLNQLAESSPLNTPFDSIIWSGSIRRKSSMGFREEDLAKAKSGSDFSSAADIAAIGTLSPERRKISHDNVTLTELWSQIRHPVNGVDFQSHRHRLRTYTDCLVGSELVDWLIAQRKSSTRLQAVLIGQALIDIKILECITSQDQIFIDGYSLYKPTEVGNLDSPVLNVVESANNSNQEGQEPLWVKEIQPIESSSTDVESDNSVEVIEVIDDNINDSKTPELHRLSSSTSTFYLDINVKESRVSISRPKYNDSNVNFNNLEQKKDDVLLTLEKKPNPKELEHLEIVIGGENEQEMISEEFLQGTLFAAHVDGQFTDDFSTPLGWHNAQILREDNGEKLAFERMNTSYEILETALLRQLLSSEGLSLSWCEIIQPLIRRVVDTVRPDIKHDNDEMDIRQYVKIKKIPGGSKAECTIVNGVGCSKNVAHKKMQQNLVNPTILLLSNSIVYQRIENKLSSLDPIIMQEHEYLKNIVSKISVYKPNVLLVEKTVSRLAQEMLLDMGITLVLNVKPCVMERVARCTQASIVSSIDAHLGRPHLGVCHHFRVQTFSLSGSKTKTLMFFDGCAANLGCTILLRGGSVAELKKVKQITNFMVYVAYNWQLERSFLMDEFAMPPSLPDELSLLIESSEHINRNHENHDAEINKKITNMGSECTTNFNNLKFSSRPTTLNLKNVKNPEVDIKLKENIEDMHKKKESKYIEDFSDPLRSYLQSEDDSIFHHHGSSLHVASLPFSNQFRKALDDVVLCISPNIKISVPYLETENGRNCELRRFFPDEIYWSEQFLKELEGSGKKNQYIDIEEVSIQSFVTNVNQDNIEILPIHPFLFTKLTTTFQDSIQTQTLLADFRARGGRIRQLCSHEISMKEKEKKLANRGDSFAMGTAGTTKSELTNAGLFWERKVDALSAYNHQRLAILFCSYSNSSNNAPSFCVSPWVVNMDFYGCNDIPLGDFLERYCFRSNYLCPSPNCDTPMTEHIRKFAHENGCVQILLHKLETSLSVTQNNIFMWSWCQKCKLTTPVVSMSQDTWSLSFAKYLELRFHGTLYDCRAVENCRHVLHHDYYQYFAHKQIVATFKYTPIVMREVVLPPLIITIQDDPIPRVAIIEEIKVLAVKGYGIYSTILERLCALKSECEDTKFEIIINEMMDQQQQETATFREKIEKIQLKLTSPTLENMQTMPSSLENENKDKDLCHLMWKIADDLLLLKKQIAEAVQGWNSRIQDFVSTRKKEEKLPTKVTQLKSLGQVLITDQSEYENTSSVLETSDTSTKDVTCVESDDFNTENQQNELEMSDSILSKKIEKIAQTVQSESVLHHSQSFDSQHSDRSSWKEKSLSLSDITLTDNELEIMDNNRKRYKQCPIPRVSSAPVGLSDNVEKFFMKMDFEQQQKEFKYSFEKFNKSWTQKFQENLNSKLPGSKTSIASDSFDSSAGIDSDLSDKRQNKETKLLENELVHTTKIMSRGHERSQSDGAENIYDIRNTRAPSRNRSEEESSNKPEKKERGTVKTIISQLLSSTAITPIQSPFPLTEHLLLIQSDKIPIIVYEQEPSSIIAYTLASSDYDKQLQELKVGLTTLNATQRESRNSSPSMKRRHQSKNNDNGSVFEVQSIAGEISPNYAKRAGMLSFFRGNERATSKQKMTSTGPLSFDAVQYSVGKVERDNLEGEEVDFSDFAFCNNQEGEKVGNKMGIKTPNLHIEVQFSEPNARFYCRVYFAEQFRKLRCLVFPENEDQYIRSLSRCVPWIARGGKSGSSFCKTHDDRFILKQMSRLEIQSFLEFAPHYFQYVNRACNEQRPTVLAKIVGVYRIGYKNTSTNAQSKLDLLVMENLFYGRNIIQKFDLKGSVRNRMVDINSQEEDIVLLDENLLKMTCDCPLYIRPHSKTVLTLAINNDSQFLFSQSVMDYSLLVGLDDKKKELVVGIIDYIRTFTWDKKLEMVVKSSGILGGHGKMPTVVSPELYRMRFCEAMDRYFLWVPDRWSGLGQSVDC